MKYADCERPYCQYPWKTPVYTAMVKTMDIAREIAGNASLVERVDMGMEYNQRPPYCLRIKRQYRTPETQQFRDTVAAVVRSRRKACRL